MFIPIAITKISEPLVVANSETDEAAHEEPEVGTPSSAVLRITECDVMEALHYSLSEKSTENSVEKK